MVKRQQAQSPSAKPKRRKTSGPANIKGPEREKYPLNTLLGLPLELRFNLYTRIFNEKPRKNGDLRILLTCRQMYQEAYALAYRHMVLIIPSWSFHDKHRSWLWSLRELSPSLRTSLRTIQFSRYQDLDTILRAGVFHPDRLINKNFSTLDLFDCIFKVLYDYGCKISSSRLDYIVHTSMMRQGYLKEAYDKLAASNAWRKRLTCGMMKRFENIELMDFIERKGLASFRLTGTRLDGSDFELVVSNDAKFGM